METSVQYEKPEWAEEGLHNFEQDPQFETFSLMLSNHELNNRFSYHPPKEDQPKRYEEIREQARILANLFNTLCPDSRELEIAMTKLEEAVMWANATIARNE